MRSFVQCFIIGALLGQIASLKNKYIKSDDKAFEASSAGIYGKFNEKDAKDHMVENIAVFLLGTLNGAMQFGEEEDKNAFYDRSVASRMTW